MMPDSVNSAEPNPPPIGSPANRWARLVRVRKRLLFVGCLVLAAGLLVQWAVCQYASTIVSNIDPLPPPRPVADAPFITTPQDIVDKMLELAGVTNEDVLYDLGCGDGRIVVTAAKRFGCRAVGFDNDPQRVKESLENVRTNQVEDLVTISQQDIFSLDLSEADVITLYLLPRQNVKLIPQLERLKPGSRIVSHDFDIQGIDPDQVVYVSSDEDPNEHTLYLWTTPLNRP